jgi:antitoxin MazE
VRAKLVKIGNSRGVRLSRPLLEQAGLVDDVEISVEPGLLTIRPAPATSRPRAGWADAAAAGPPEPLLDPPTPTRFEDEDWQW